ncbi:S-DNA-T family DNA segregation ATPase FtsK/SpoIIIE [Rhodobacter sp. 140A]|nr:S-DNA-T family DNA segregation ATPase FtsK/SpoIIIE [Rhodobacter sp. 140A]
MASYQARQRDPLLDQNTQAALERRGKELLGGVLVFAGVLVGMLLASYSPDDPSWMAVSDAPVQNWLGRIGAGIASPLYVIVGRGAWLLPLGLIAWGVRHILHRGEERLGTRAVFLPIGVALASVYAALLVPGADWGQAFGLGGHFGDMIAGSLLGMSPVSGSIGLKLMSLVLALATIAMSAFVLGFDRAEIQTITRFLLLGSVAAYDAALTAFGRGAAASVRMAQGAAQQAAERARQRRAEAAERAADLAAWEAQQAAWEQSQGGYAPAAAQPAMSAAAKSSLLSRIRRAPEPDYAQEDGLLEYDSELVERGWPAPAVEAPSEDRIRARIAQAVKTRAVAPMVHAEPEDWEAMEPAPVAMPELRATPRQAEPAPYSAPQHYAPQPAPAPATPASVLAAVAARLARGARPAAPVPAAPVRRSEPPIQARPRFLPGSASAPASHLNEPVLRAPEPTAAVPHVVAPELPPMWETAVDEAPLHDAALTHPDAAPAYVERAVPREAVDPAATGWETPRVAREADDADDWAETDFDRNAFADLDEEIPQVPASAPRIMLNRQVVPPAPERRVMAPPRKAHVPSKQAIAEAQPKLRFEPPAHPAYEPPPLNLLTNPTTIQRHSLSDDALEENARMLENVLDDYGVKGEIVSVRPGPVVTMYELEPAPGLKASRVIGLADDIARSMSALSARVSTVPGRSVIGIELPNVHREKVVLREILAARDFGDSNLRLPLALGKDIGGEPVIANLAKMPHLLIAGTTGSGKSVAINTMILSLLYKLSPEECRLIMIDPKMLELSVYDGIPHLLSPVVTDPKKAVVALKWVVGEMEERYRRMSKMGVRNIEGYNGRVREAMDKGEMFKRTVQTGFDEETGEPVFETEEFQPQPFPYIVVIVDEMADLMMVAGKEIEACIQRLAQMARASGIHLIMATQRPSVDVITGTIKANFPTRISFQVTSKIDSRTILGEQGAEQLLGMGDMLYMGAGSRITRIHGPFVSDEEVEEIVNHLKSFGPPQYMSGVLEGPDEEVASDIDAVLGLGSGDDAENALYDTAVAIVIKDRKCSTSYIQRKLGIGYNKAARLVEQMEEQGVVSPANHVGKREILVPEQ